MLSARDRDAGSEDPLEHVEFGAAQRTARRGGVADRTMVLDQEEVVAVGAYLCKVSLIGSHVGQSLQPVTKIARTAELALVHSHLSIGSGRDHSVECRVAKCRTQRTDQVDAQFAVPIGEHLSGRWCQLPVHGRAAAARGLGHRASDHSGVFERVQMLTQGCVGESEFAGEIGGGCRLDALQPVNDPALGIGLLGHLWDSTARCRISEVTPCIMSNARDLRWL
jgi:hypothetical protein